MVTKSKSTSKAVFAKSPAAKQAPAKKSRAKPADAKTAEGAGLEQSAAATPSGVAAAVADKNLRKTAAKGGGPSVAEAQATHGRAGPSQAAMEKEVFRRDRLNPDGTPKSKAPLPIPAHLGDKPTEAVTGDD